MKSNNIKNNVVKGNSIESKLNKIIELLESIHQEMLLLQSRNYTIVGVPIPPEQNPTYQAPTIKPTITPCPTYPQPPWTPYAT